MNRRRARSEAAETAAQSAKLTFTEPEPPVSLAITRSLIEVVIGFLVGTGGMFAVLLVGGIVGEEALFDLYAGADLDFVGRGGAGALLLFVAGGAVLLPVLGAIERAQLLAVVERHAVEHADAVPPAGVRERVKLSPARGLARLMLGLGIVALVVGAVIAIVLTEGADDPEPWVTLGVCAVLALGWLGLRPVWRALDSSWSSRADLLREQWTRRVPLAVAADERRRRDAISDPGPRLLDRRSTRGLGRATGAAGALLFVSLAAWFVSVWLRQPCRTCDERFFDDPMDQVISVWSLVGGVAILISAVFLAIVALAWLVVIALRERAAARWVADGRLRRAPVSMVAWLLVSDRAAVLAARTLAAIGAALLMVALSAIWFTVPWVNVGLFAGIAAALLVVASVMGAADARRAARARNALRATCAPGDPTRVELAAATRTRGGRESEFEGAGPSF